MIRGMLVAALAFSQSAPGLGGTTGSLPVSPSVMATIMSSVDADGNGTLDLLVLWRGSAGWFKGDGGSASGGGGTAGGGGTGSASRPEVRTAWLSQGGVSLSVRLEPSTRKVWIQNQEMDLNESNVVLVDQVDQSGGPLVLRALRINPSYRAVMELPPQGVERMRGFSGAQRPAPVPPQTFIRRSPELFEYLRCDVGWPGAPQAETLAFQKWCSAAAPQ